MKRCVRAALALLLFGLAALPLSACARQEWQDLLLFCEAYSALAQAEEPLTAEDFSAQLHSSAAVRYQCYLREDQLLTVETLPNGRIHTLSLTGLPEGSQTKYQDAAQRLLIAFSGVTPDLAARLLHAAEAGKDAVPSLRTAEENGLRLSYCANGAGRYLLLSRVRLLPQTEPRLTLRESTAATDTIPQ
ncbi:MAG: hypothetical protein LBQ33_03455 [Oscillospiraceae bacterium]|jgi:hypothetical protein|nr:hypothetical protein [Oscillospiraceae bacterium]